MQARHETTNQLVNLDFEYKYLWYLCGNQSGLRQSIKAFEIIENEAKRDEREALDEFLISVMLGPSPHRPRARQTKTKLLLPQRLLDLNDLPADIVHETLNAQLHLYVLSEHRRDWARIVPSTISSSFRRTSGEGVRYAYVPHLANVVLVQLFRVAILTLQVWLGTVRVRVEYALNVRRENVRDRIFEWGDFALGGFVGSPLIGTSGSRSFDVLEHLPQRALRNTVVELSWACHLHLVPIRFEFDTRLGEVVVYFHRISVLCVIYCLTTERARRASCTNGRIGRPIDE
jgi:hypothetical protein